MSFTSKLADWLRPNTTVHAHCDIPCAIYDPHQAQIGALSVIRMNQLIEQLQMQGQAKEEHDRYIHQIARYTKVKEDHAEIVKHEVRVIWGDYFKPEHLEQYPDLHSIVFNIMKLASKGRQEINMQAAQDLLSEVNRFAEIFWATKGVPTKRQPSNQTAGGEFVVPAN
ncbi:MAG TPA: superoxide dismutase, Ni [Dehalococcoidia bacterium]|nr:superoxide dismutase, Ni [Dehalococcoidia bacterium]